MYHAYQRANVALSKLDLWKVVYIGFTSTLGGWHKFGNLKKNQNTPVGGNPYFQLAQGERGKKIDVRPANKWPGPSRDTN